MSATVVLVESNGHPAADTIITSLPMGSVDAPNLDPDTNKITAGQNSFEKWIRAKITALTSDLNIVDNFRIYLSDIGAGWKADEGIKCNLSISDKVYVAASYPAGGPVASLSAVAIYDLPVDEPAQGNVGIGGDLSAQIIPTTTLPVYTDYAVLQLQTAVDTPTGAVNPKVLTVQWDEQ